MEGLLGQKLNRHEFNLVSASKLSFSKESGKTAVRFIVESGTAQLKFHYEAELRNVVVRVDLWSAQVFELGPVESICVDEGSDGGENEKQGLKIIRMSQCWIQLPHRTGEDEGLAELVVLRSHGTSDGSNPELYV